MNKVVFTFWITHNLVRISAKVSDKSITNYTEEEMVPSDAIATRLLLEKFWVQFGLYTFFIPSIQNCTNSKYWGFFQFLNCVLFFRSFLRPIIYHTIPFFTFQLKLYFSCAALIPMCFLHIFCVKSENSCFFYFQFYSFKVFITFPFEF